MPVKKKKKKTKLKHSNNKGLFLLLGVLICVLPIWIFVVAPQVTKLSEVFFYEAEIDSFDNFYSEDKKAFLGEQRSVTRFSYRSYRDAKGKYTINNVFDVRTLEGEPIFSVSREYGVDPVLKKHSVDGGDKKRQGYLFAPENLKKGESFTYWHINYDGPADMKYVGEENLFGLNVYKYFSSYENVKIDQTKNLTHLPDVGKTRGVIVEPTLELWIEPITGRMIKYKDNAIAYYYDLSTGKKIHPWNSFYNVYKKSSIIDQVEIAKKEKTFFLFIHKVIPILLTILVLSLIIGKILNKKIAILLFVLGSLSVFGYVGVKCYLFKDKTVIKIGISKWVSDENFVYDDNIKGFKEALSLAGVKEGKDVEFIQRSAKGNEKEQKNIANEFLQEEVDLVYSLTTPGTLILKETLPDNIPIIFSIVTYPVETGVIHSLQNSKNNLVGTRNWVSVERQLETFLEILPDTKSIAFIHRTGEPNSTIQFEEMKKIAKSKNIEIKDISVTNKAEILSALNIALPVGGIFSSCDTLIQGEAEELIISFAKKNKTPSFTCNASGVKKGDLVGTVADFYDLGKLSGEKALEVLTGVPPSVLETNTVSRPHVLINKNTADELGILIPQNVLSKAERIIE